MVDEWSCAVVAQERETISRELSRGKSARYIGKLLGRHHGTIAREIERNGGAADYRAVNEVTGLTMAA